MFILDQKFWTRNARKWIKGSKDSTKHFGLAVGP